MAAQSSGYVSMPVPQKTDTASVQTVDGGSPQDTRTKILTVDPSTYVPKIEIRTLGGLLTEVRVTQRDKTPEQLAFDQLKMAILTQVTPEEAREKVTEIMREMNPKIDNAEFLQMVQKLGQNLKNWEVAISEAVEACADRTASANDGVVDPASLLMAVNKVEPGLTQRLQNISFQQEKDPDEKA